MPRRKKVTPTKRDWRWYAHTGLNVFVALSMVLGTVVLFTGNTFQRQNSIVFPTELPVSDIPTLAPTVGAPLGTPAATPAVTPTAKP